MKIYTHPVYRNGVGGLKIGQVMYWYDPKIRCWTVVAQDHNEDQIEGALYCAGGAQNEGWKEANIKHATTMVEHAWKEEASR